MLTLILAILTSVASNRLRLIIRTPMQKIHVGSPALKSFSIVFSVIHKRIVMQHELT
jgi:hypothetical protein